MCKHFFVHIYIHIKWEILCRFLLQKLCKFEESTDDNRSNTMNGFGSARKLSSLQRFRSTVIRLKVCGLCDRLLTVFQVTYPMGFHSHNGPNVFGAHPGSGPHQNTNQAWAKVNPLSTSTDMPPHWHAPTLMCHVHSHNSNAAAMTWPLWPIVWLWYSTFHADSPQARPQNGQLLIQFGPSFRWWLSRTRGLKCFCGSTSNLEI